MAARYGRGQALTNRQVHTMLLEMADKLERVRPDEPITTIGRHALLQATTMDPPLLSTLRERAPEIDGELVRRAYAAQLRQSASETGAPTPVQALTTRVLTLAADNLRPYETSPGWVPGHTTPVCMTDGLRDIVIGRALDTVLTTVRQYATQNAVRAAVRAVLPPVAGSVGEYAAQLRKTEAPA
ncbi:hypothetical protein JL475_24410 [Streptomyces sp. M2CJ-2]|uniref:hypothetical protein n=1 Tax=Streptomyces sp. M2CJ-2 TaxID=2803948 RepID=UPI001925AA43|nr:hypothetical protein [Streptomyces sp. M2CJ-2]MBL3669079.1 hypothetical protein [Streptomyces sp. M2CJ-2]